MADAYETATNLVAGAAAVTALIGTRYWPDVRENETLPAVTFTSIAETRHDHLDSAGTGMQARISFSCYATTRTGAAVLANALEAAIKNSGRVVFRQSFYDGDVQVYITQMDLLTIIDSP